MSSTKLDIIKCLIKEENPLILNHIAKKVGKSAQSVEYNIKQLLHQNVLMYATDDDDKKYYFLAIPFYNKELVDSLYQYLTPFAEEVSSQLPENTDYKDVVCMLGYILQLFIDDASKKDVSK